MKKTESITVGLKENTHKELKILCAEHRWTMTEAVNALLESFREHEALIVGEIDAQGKKKKDNPPPAK